MTGLLGLEPGVELGPGTLALGDDEGTGRDELLELGSELELLGSKLRNIGSLVWSGEGVGMSPSNESSKISFCGPSRKLYRSV